MRRIAMTLYVLSSITVLAGAAVAPALAEIGSRFSDADPVWIKMIITLPAIMVIPCTILAHRLCGRFGKKPVLMCGLILYFVGGCGGGLVDNLWLLLASRAVLGVGMGIITPVCHALPADFFSGHERMVVVSRMSAFVTIGACLCSIGAGWLALVSWRASFGVYAISALVLLLVAIFLPAARSEEHAPAETDSGSGLPLRVWGLALGMLSVMATFYLFPTGIADHLEATRLGDARIAGYLLALVSLVAFLVSLSFTKLSKVCGPWIVPLLIACMGSGYMLVWQGTSGIWIIVGSCLTGAGLGGLTPLHFVATNRAVSKERIVKAMSVVIAGNFAGQFLSPFVFRFVEWVALPGGSGSSFGFMGLLLMLAAASLTLRQGYVWARQWIQIRYS